MQVRYIVDTIYDEITIVKVSDAAAGTPATAYRLISSASAISKNTSNVFNPASITFTSKTQTGSNAVANYSGRFIIAETTNGTDFTNKYTSSANESSKTYSPSSTSVTAIRVRMYQAGGTSVLLDEQLIPIVADGKEAVTAVLSNDSHNIPCNTSGTPSTYAGAVTTMSVFVGATDTSTSWTYTATPTNVTGTASNNNRTYTVTGISADTGYVDITATRSGYSSVTKRFTLAKSKQGNTGATGAPAYTVVLTNESHTFPGSTSAALAGSTTCGIIAYKGASKVNASIGTISGIPTGMTVTPVNNNTQNASLTIAVTTSMTTKNGTLPIPITVDGKVFNKNFSYALALKGSTGATGPQGPTGPTGPQGPQGEAKDYYDATFMDGKKYWSTAFTDTYTEPGTNVMVVKEKTSKCGGNVLQIQNDTWLYAKNKIAIEQGKIYKFTFRVRQTQDPLNGADKNKVYAGATTFNAAGDKLSPNNGTYFIASSQGITVANGWKEYTAYMSTTAKLAIVNTQDQVLCPAVKAFDSGTVAIKPMFIVNYSGGTGIAQVDGLTIEDYTETWNLLDKLSSKLDDNMEDVFNALTNNGDVEGIYMENNQLYINGQYINAKKLSVTNSLGTKTLEVTHDGNVNINALSLKIGGISVPDKIEQDIDAIDIQDRNLIRNSTWNFGLTKYWTLSGSESTLSCYRVLEPEDDKPFSSILNMSRTGLTSNGNLQAHCAEITGFVNKKMIISFDVKVKDKSVLNGGQFMCIRAFDSTGLTAQADSVWYKNVSVPLDSITNNQWVKCKMEFTPTAGTYLRLAPYLTRNGDISFRELKLTYGTKQGDWSPAPEDLEESLSNKPNSDEIIENINQTPQTTVFISADKINLEGAVKFSHLSQDKGELGNAFVQEENTTLIDGGMIKTKSVMADKIDVYDLLVKKRKNTGTVENPVWVEEDIPTFNVSSTGNITASGTFKSFNYKEGSNIEEMQGWMISEDGDSTFNNTLIRGRVELPTAGITNEGKQNLIPYTDFSISSNMSKFKTRGSNMTLTYSSSDGGYITCQNTTLDVADGGVGILTPTLRAGLKNGVKYTLSFKARSSSNTGTLDYIYIMSNVSGVDNQKIGSVNINSYDSWNDTQNITFTPNKDYSQPTILIGFTDAVITGNSNKKGFAIKDIRLVEDDSPSIWFEDSPVRFYAGTDHDNRNNAPFKVLQDGSVFAKKGTFGGTFTGEINIGNIIIKDEVGTSSKPVAGIIQIKNDANSKTVVQIGEDSSWFNSNLYLGDGDKAKINIEPSSSKINIKQGASIDLDSGNSSLSLKNTASGAYLQFGSTVNIKGNNNELRFCHYEESGPISIKIGNFADPSSHDDASVEIDGPLFIGSSFTMSGVRVVYSSEGDGVDFIITN